MYIHMDTAKFSAEGVYLAVQGAGCSLCNINFVLLPLFCRPFSRWTWVSQFFLGFLSPFIPEETFEELAFYGLDVLLSPSQLYQHLGPWRKQSTYPIQWPGLNLSLSAVWCNASTNISFGLMFIICLTFLYFIDRCNFWTTDSRRWCAKRTVMCFVSFFGSLSLLPSELSVGQTPVFRLLSGWFWVSAPQQWQWHVVVMRVKFCEKLS